MKKLLIIVFTGFAFISAEGQNTKTRMPFVYDTIFTKPTVLASFPGGDTAWKKYVKKNLKYPRKAWWEELETDVFVRVTIAKDGTVERAEHLTTSGYGFEKEAVRLVMDSGRWIPATFEGKPVKSEGELKIEFRLR